MNFSMRRVNAIFQKDFKDVSRNYAVSMSALMPLILAFIYGRFGDISIEAHYMVINLTFVVVGTFLQCCLIAEEKEKNTLRGLMLSPASTMEILSGKSLLSFISTIAIIVVSAYLTGYQPENTLVILFVILLSSFFYIGLGTVLGLFTKSVMEASVIAMPFIFIFGFSSMVIVFADKYPILKVLNYTPNEQLIKIAVAVENGGALGEIWFSVGIIALWVVGIFGLAAFVFTKRKRD